ncbi:unnamed protein product, partial [marine sediment metagenome]
ECVDGCVVRMTNAYPVYADNHEDHRQTIKKWLNEYFKNVFPAGRGGLHMYNNQDHSMMAAILSVQNVIEDAGFDVWAINSDAEYAEEGQAATEVEERLVPKALS